MEQTEIEKQVSQIKKKHYCANNKSVGEQFTDALIEALSLNRSVPTKVTDEEIEKEYKKLWDDKPIGTITSFGWVAGAKWMRDKLPITLDLPESKNVPSEETDGEKSALKLHLEHKNTHIENANKRINALTFERNHLRDVIEIKEQNELMIVERLKELETIQANYDHANMIVKEQDTRIQELEGKLKEAKEEMKFHAVKLLSFYIINTHRDDETLEDIYERFIKF